MRILDADSPKSLPSSRPFPSGNRTVAPSNPLGEARHDSATAIPKPPSDKSWAERRSPFPAILRQKRWTAASLFKEMGGASPPSRFVRIQTYSCAHLAFRGYTAAGKTTAIFYP